VKLDFIHETRTNVTKMRYGMLKKGEKRRIDRTVGIGTSQFGD